MYLTFKLKRMFNRVRSSRQRQRRPERVQAYLRQALALVERAERVRCVSNLKGSWKNVVQ